MASSDEPADGVRSKRAKKVHGLETRQFLLLAREALPRDLYSVFVKTMKRIWKQCADPDGEIRNISIEDCIETAMKIFDGQTRAIKGFRNFTEGRSPFHDDLEKLQDPLDFLHRVKTCPDISTNDFKALVNTLLEFCHTRTMTAEDVFQKVKGFLANCPELLEEFKTYLPPHLREPLPDEQSCRSPKTSRVGKAVLSFTPDANHSLDGIRVKATNRRNKVSQLDYAQDQNPDGREYSFMQKHTQRIPDFVQKPTKEGNEESPHAEEDKEDKVEPLPDWSPSRENELPPKVDLGICTPCTPSYCRLPDNCATVQSSYQTELGRSILNNVLISVTSGSEDCFKFRTKNQYEENIFKCEDDMFESDMLLQRFRATADFIENLQDNVDSDTKIQEHLTPLHRRCIEQLYDDYGLDMLDSLSKTENASAALAVLLSRINQKIEDLSEARLSLYKTCSDIIANNYNRSLDHRSPSFKQLDIKRMSPKALLAEAKEINNTKCNYADLHMHEDIGSIVHYAYSRSCTSKDKTTMTWTELVKSFFSVSHQRPDSKNAVALKEACECCGISKDLLSSIPNALLANKFLLSSKRGEYVRNKSNGCTSLHDGCDEEIEEGEFIPDVENIQLDAMLGPGKGTASYVAACSGDGLSFRSLATNTSGRSTCDLGNESEEQHESRDDSNNEVGSLACSKRTAKLRDVKGGSSCCSLVVLCRLSQILYERLLIAKVLSSDASTKVLYRGAWTRDLYADFKEKLCNLLDGSTDNRNFEDFCLKFLGPKSYSLFTLDKLIARIIKQLCIIYPSHEEDSVLRIQEKSRTNLPKELLCHQNARGCPALLLNGLADQDREEEEKGSEPFKDIGKAKQNHFQRRKKRKLDNGAASLSHPGVEDSSS